MKKGIVSMYMDKVLWKKFHLACVEHDVTMSQKVEEMIDAQLKEWTTLTTNTISARLLELSESWHPIDFVQAYRDDPNFHTKIEIVDELKES